MGRFIDLSHPLVSGELTYRWLPAPRVVEFLSREQSRDRYTAGTEFAIHQVELIGNSGTYIDSPFHRYADGIDLAELPLARLASLPAVVVRVPSRGDRAIGPAQLNDIGLDLREFAVLFHTGQAAKWAKPDYADGAPFITGDLAADLRDRGVALVGIDALNADDTDDPTRPAHSVLLGAGIPIVENLCQLELLPNQGFRFSAVPVAVRGCGSFPVRAFAEV